MEPRPGKKSEDLTALCEALGLAARGWGGGNPLVAKEVRGGRRELHSGASGLKHVNVLETGTAVWVRTDGIRAEDLA